MDFCGKKGLREKIPINLRMLHSDPEWFAAHLNILTNGPPSHFIRKTGKFPIDNSKFPAYNTFCVPETAGGHAPVNPAEGGKFDLRTAFVSPEDTEAVFWTH